LHPQFVRALHPQLIKTPSWDPGKGEVTARKWAEVP